MSQSVPDLITAVDRASTLIDDVNDRLHWMKRERPDDREDILAAADRAGRAWAEIRLLITMLRELGPDVALVSVRCPCGVITTGVPEMQHACPGCGRGSAVVRPPRSTPTPLELHQRELL